MEDPSISSGGSSSSPSPPPPPLNNSSIPYYYERFILTQILSELISELEHIQDKKKNEDTSSSISSSTSSTTDKLLQPEDIVGETLETLAKLEEYIGRRDINSRTKKKNVLKDKEQEDIIPLVPSEFLRKKVGTIKKNPLEFILDAIKATKNEISGTSSSFPHKFTTKGLSMDIYSSKILERSQALDKLKGRVVEKGRVLMELERRVVLEEEENRGKLRGQMLVINELKDKLAETLTSGDEDKAFVSHWIQSSNDSITTKHNQEIKGLKDNLKSLKECKLRDVQAYEDVFAWTSLKVSKMDKEIQEWEEKRRSEVQELQGLIEHKNEVVIKGKERKIEELKKSIEEMIEALIPWEEEKEQERIERLKHMRRYYSVRKIQRWWRKYMVQHGLYDKAKKKKKVRIASKSKGKTTTTKKTIIITSQKKK